MSANTRVSVARTRLSDLCLMLKSKINAMELKTRRIETITTLYQKGGFVFRNSLHKMHGLCKTKLGRTNGEGTRNPYNRLCVTLKIYSDHRPPQYESIFASPESEAECVDNDSRGDLEWDGIRDEAIFTAQGLAKMNTFKAAYQSEIKQGNKGWLGIYIVALKDEVAAKTHYINATRPIAQGIREIICAKSCAHCGTPHNICVDHKLDLCEKSVLRVATQLETDFQPLCNTCNTLKRGHAGKHGREARESKYSVFPLTKPETHFTPFERRISEHGSEDFKALKSCLHESFANEYIELRRLIQSMSYWSNCEWHGNWDKQFYKPLTVESVCAMLAHEAIEIPNTREQWRDNVTQLFNETPHPDVPTVCERLYDFIDHTLDMGRSRVAVDHQLLMEQYAQVRMVVKELCDQIERNVTAQEEVPTTVADDTQDDALVVTVQSGFASLVL